MITREAIEKREYEIMSPFAAKVAETRGRRTPEEKCAIRTDYQRDKDRIIHSKSFRRLMHKTQVFLAPEGDHFRTRLTHTIEVSQIARTIARSLGLNEDLTEAIAMGHDLGHTPFGHNGEKVLNELYEGGFRHNVQSLRVVDVLESNGVRRGMNLTQEVRDGILNHTGPGIPYTLEGQVVKISDRVAYINHDIDDALRSGVITAEDLPKNCIQVLGETHRARINTLVTDLINSSFDQDHISMSESCFKHMNLLRDFMFENVYHNNRVKKDEDLEKVKNILESLYRYYLENPGQLPKDLQELIPEFGLAEITKDHIAGMTDRYAMNLYTDLFVPKGWK
ncbi:deoxyguanosinetriphosphate triphosphohydrolase [Ihubacter massiliensis]|uniref:Deoxyguanosinetriphosphate triphosphohydrolase-like protein n=1 Tax=Hominibacterium faecale TaxID=2839743 RepID=A0A9J6QPD2_9FIRM|nr:MULTISPECIES: deoxyguanosinetriphosphate triphosphohydrolase [Eubacteriales Family XIII. Incertae Sedis]MCC2865365.1 deoxyguanosinetriphosphate triphosphohydrolase [Anaerovorax odorimutans]MCO7120918.1 deoxyguanosinetriphosphate triphosphohydrolase [Ihubacter massiliensis]MCU7377834.1 deoxyguanosinetriphosphate triphosphohydrolase [Hominibacterium faecale]MDE8732908.1 deoxyguanosinetriphosphate triphosphohydrolase [Eubacteriales bacterium DFI.9.88]